MSVNSVVTWIHKSNSMFYHCWAKTLEICLLTFRRFPSTPRGEWDFPECISLLPCLLHVCLSPFSGLPVQDQHQPAYGKIYGSFCSHTHGSEWIWCSNSNWTSTFRSIYEWCCSLMSELEHYGFWATVLFLQNLCWIKNTYHLGKK